MKLSKLVLFSTLFVRLNCINSQAQTLTEKIRINQVGFFTEGIKKAIAIDFTESKYEIWTSDHSKKVYSGSMTKNYKWDASCEDNIQIADFSNFKHDGTYIIVIGSKKSYTFTISNNAMDTVAKTQMKYFYFNRCSYELKEQYAGKYARKAGHLNTGVIPIENPNRRISMPGGWYDAGDYGLYMQTASFAACEIMMAYEQFPTYWNKTEWNIPESGNGVPDILDEVKYELKWMKNMKDTDNGVWYKATSKAFAGWKMPADENSDIYCMVKNATSAYDYAATFAMAYRIYKRYDKQYPNFSDTCLAVAKLAWTWGVNNETKYPGCKNPTGVTTGEYKDDIAYNGNDNKVLAGVELFLSTNDSSYIKPVLKSAQNGFVNGEAYWYEKRPIATMDLALHGDLLAKNKLIEYANSQVEYQNNHGYNVNIGATKYEFDWGSNSRISDRGMAMMGAYVLTKDIRFLNGVTNTMDYILGRNATGYSFITGLGSKQGMHPHHRISVSDTVEAPQPGLPIQGPYYGRMGQCAPNIVSFCAAKNYIDDECSYSSNEICINQAAPHVFNLGGLMQYLEKPLNIEISAPLNDSIIIGTDVTIVANATAKINSISRVDFYNGNKLLSSISNSPYSYSLKVSPGEYTITAIAFNNKNDSAIAQTHFIVGNASPRVKIIEPMNNAYFAPSQAVMVNASAIDIDGSISKVSLNLNGKLIQTITKAPYIFTIPSIPDSISTIEVIAYDDKDSSTKKQVTVKASCTTRISNGEFNDGSKSWLLLNALTGKGSQTIVQPGLSGNNALKVSIQAKGKNSSDIQLQQLCPIKKGIKYTISYNAKADSTRAIEFNVQHESDEWDVWEKHIVSIDTIKTFNQLYFHTFTALYDDDSSKVKFFLGASSLASVYLDNIIVSVCPNPSAEIESLSFLESEIEMKDSIYKPNLVFKNKAGMNINFYPLPAIVWASSDSNVVSVDAMGKLKAKKIGTSNITATLVSNTSLHASVKVTVKTIVEIPDQSNLVTVVKPTITKDLISISADEEIQYIEIISLSGKIVNKISCKAMQQNISLKDLTEGQYIVRIVSINNKVNTEKVVKY